MRKLFVLLIAAMLSVSASNAYALKKPDQPPAQTQENADKPIDFDIKDEGSPKRENASGNPVVETKKSLEVPAPDNKSQLTPNQLQILTEILAATELENAQLKLEQVQLQRAEQQQQFIEITQPKPVVVDPKALEPSPEDLKMSRAFPMPGGNPQVVSILGGNKKALEATLVFPNGLKYEVHKGMILEGGYRVANVSSNGVVLEKNGFKLPMPLSSGSVEDKSDKPWDRGQEMGIPTNQPPSMPMPPQNMPMPPQGSRRR